jgi:glutamine amidotransferase
VGSFGYCIEILNESRDASSFFKKFLEQEGKLLIGICIGMQLLGDTSEESDGYSGLGLIPWNVRKIKVNSDQRLPHVGWNSIDSIPNNLKTSDGILDLYFDHSYKIVCDPELVISKTFYGEEIPAMIKKGNIVGIQFHPELSGQIGSDILKHIIRGELNC